MAIFILDRVFLAWFPWIKINNVQELDHEARTDGLFDNQGRRLLDLAFRFGLLINLRPKARKSRFKSMSI